MGYADLHEQHDTSARLRAFSNPPALHACARSLPTKEAACVYHPLFFSSLFDLSSLRLSEPCAPPRPAALLAAATLVGAASIDIPRAATVNGTAGCGTTHWFNGITQYHSLQSGTRSRDYSIHLPSSSVGFFFEADTGLSGSKYSAEKILVYPNGLGGAWAGANYSEATVPEDLQFVSDLLDEIRSGWCIDNSRIYATGLSIGGGFVNTIACAPVGGNFAAFAAGSGSFYTDNGGVTGGGVTGQSCTPARSPLPVLEIHGGAIRMCCMRVGRGRAGLSLRSLIGALCVPSSPSVCSTPPSPSLALYLGENCSFLPNAVTFIFDRLSRWATRNGCTAGNTTETLFSGDVHHSSWACAGVEGESVLQHWKVDDMRHCWASTSLDFSEIAAGQGPTPIDASTIVMAFFDQFVKP
ncbi:hypothetical protein B0H14DRAFT_3444744 [Mycena olivaceomarginata]|nr:hypothetical protein B0H14DRAFT_3444744 [Mycena olivaceomarginata]